MAFYKFTNHIFCRIMSKASFVLLAMIVIEAVAFYTSAKNTDFNLSRYEQVLEKANLNNIFIIIFVLLLVCISISVLELEFGTKGIYSIMQLPLSKAQIFYSFFISGISCIFIFACIQMILGLIFGWFLPIFFPKDVSQLLAFDYFRNYTSLAFVRSDILSLIFPLSFASLISSLLLLTVPVIAVIYGAVFILFKKYISLLLLLPLLIFLIISSTVNLTSAVGYFLLYGITAGITVGMVKLVISNLKVGESA